MMVKFCIFHFGVNQRCFSSDILIDVMLFKVVVQQLDLLHAVQVD